jgi:hypothetical protein
MTVTNQLSTQVTNHNAGTITDFGLGFGGRLFPMFVTTTQAALGCANSTFELGILPPGNWYYVSWLSRLRTSVFGTSRTLDIGFGAYTNPDGTAVTANASAIHSAKDVSSATSWFPGQGDELDDATGEYGLFQVNSKTSVTVTAICKAGTVPASAHIDGVLFFLSY